MASTFWFGKTVLVAGATGFLGGWLVRRLVEYGAHVVTLVRSNKPESQFFMRALDNRVSVEWGDVADQRVIERIFQRHSIDVFFHAAYGADVNRVLDEPLECFRSSALSTWRILDFLRKNRPNCISVISSTDKVYGRQPIPCREDMGVQPLHPYETAKASQDFAAQSYGKIFKCPVAVTRCGNYFGGYDFNFTRLVPGVVRSIMQGEAPILRSNGRFTRDFLYIDDAVDVQLLLAQRLSENPELYGEAFNFSYGERLEVREIVQRICRLLDAPFDPVVNENCIPEIPHIELSSEKAKQLLDWKPSHGFARGLERTVRWYRDYFSPESVHVVKYRGAQEEALPVEDANNAIMIRNFEGTITSWNEGAAQLYGWAPKEALARQSHSLLHTIFPQPLQRIEDELRRTGHWEGNLEHVRRDGVRVIVRSRWDLRRGQLNSDPTVVEINRLIA